MKLLVLREMVETTLRGHVSLGTKRRTWKASAGMCFWCGHAVPMLGPDVQYDHAICLGLGGPDEEANIGPLHTRPCHKQKTASDLRRIAKAKRQRKLIEEVVPPKRPIPSRGFLKHLTRTFGGLTRRRK